MLIYCLTGTIDWYALWFRLCQMECNFSVCVCESSSQWIYSRRLQWNIWQLTASNEMKTATWEAAYTKRLCRRATFVYVGWGRATCIIAWELLHLANALYVIFVKLQVNALILYAPPLVVDVRWRSRFGRCVPCAAGKKKATQENYEHIGCCVRVFEVVIGLP